MHQFFRLNWKWLYGTFFIPLKTKRNRNSSDSFCTKARSNGEFATVFSKLKPFKKDYGSYSEKAIKKLLSLMRMGKYWKEENIDENTRNRIDKIINAEYDERISLRTRDQVKKFEEKKTKELNGEYHLDEISKFKNLPLSLACYIVYNRHSEAREIEKWEKPEDIELYLKTLSSTLCETRLSNKLLQKRCARFVTYGNRKDKLTKSILSLDET